MKTYILLGFFFKSVMKTIFFSTLLLFFAIQHLACQPTGIEMVSIPASTFLIGNTSSNQGEPNEYPVHTVSIGTFEIGKYEVTQAQFEKIMGYNPSKNKGATKPVERVSWFDAVSFCNRLSELEGLEPCYTMHASLGYQCNFEANGYRLPTEAEWILASSKTQQEIPAFQLTRFAWHAGNSGNETKEVGRKQGNEYGLYDIYGNIWEWCFDYYAEDYFKQSPVKSPTGPQTGKLKVLKGGAMDAQPQYNRNSYRYRLVPEYTSHNIGFRVARSGK